MPLPSRESQSAIEKHTFAIFVNLTHLLHMEGLWSSGIPELKRFIFILQKYMQLPHSFCFIQRIHCPSLQGVGFGEDERKNELIIQHAMMYSASFASPL